jgi:ABC-2 type transport system ATP-binding protein
MNSIELIGVSKNFGNVKALQDINLSFEEGKIYGLLGRNGAGKTTMMKIMYEMLFPSAGIVRVDGREVVGNDTALNKMFFIGEKNYFPEYSTVEKAFYWMKKFRPEFDSTYAHRLTDAFGLQTKKYIRSLSTGYKSIFKNILALASNAPYILLDEPVLGLDANHRDMFYKFMIEKYSESPYTAIISTHLIEEVASIVEHVVIIKEGLIIRDEPREALMDSGYSVSGRAEDVRAFISGKEVLGIDALGGFEMAYVFGTCSKSELPEGLEICKMDLQRLFIQLTNS